MNERFVNIKVDREERPDLDQTYQLVVQLMGRGGGWPLTVFLTPERRPFFGGTYFPPVDRYGMPGFPKVLEAVSDAYRAAAWRGRCPGDGADRAPSQVARPARPSATGGVRRSARTCSREPRRRLARALRRRARGLRATPQVPEHDGARPDAPRARRRRRGPRARDARARRDARGRRSGTSSGGGFHRYSTDERVARAPLREDALRQRAALAALRRRLARDGDARFAETARAIAAYVAREMTATRGAASTRPRTPTARARRGSSSSGTRRDPRRARGRRRGAAELAVRAGRDTEEGNFEAHGQDGPSRRQDGIESSAVQARARAVARRGGARARAREAVRRARGARRGRSATRRCSRAGTG